VIITHDFVINPNVSDNQTFEFESSVGYENDGTETVIYDDNVDNNYDSDG